MTPSKTLLQAIAVTAELTGTTLSEPAARVFAQDLSRFPEPQVLRALTRCRREVKGRLTPADVIYRLDDGRPGPEEAWAMIPKDEAGSVVWTDEMAVAYGVSAPLIKAGDHVAARMAFIEHYRKTVMEARDSSKPVKWTPSLGHDASGREGVLIEAVRKGRISAQHATALLPYHNSPPPEIAALIDKAIRKELTR